MNIEREPEESITAFTMRRIRAEIIEECAAIADKEADLLLFTGARFRTYATPGPNYYSDADLHEQAGTAVRSAADKIRALVVPLQERG